MVPAMSCMPRARSRLARSACVLPGSVWVVGAAADGVRVLGEHANAVGGRPGEQTEPGGPQADLAGQFLARRRTGHGRRPSAVRARPAAAWSRSVDLPIPGSPPMSTSEPGTSPPPRTRSSSPIPSRQSRDVGFGDRRGAEGRERARHPAARAGRPRPTGGLAHDGLDQGVPRAAGAALAFPAEEGSPHAWQT